MSHLTQTKQVILKMLFPANHLA